MLPKSAGDSLLTLCSERIEDDSQNFCAFGHTEYSERGAVKSQI